MGFSWEGFALEETLIRLRVERDAYFYKTHGGAELDLLIEHGARRYGFEFKFRDAPTTTHSMHVVISDLKLDHLFVVYPGGNRYPLADKIEVLPLKDLDSQILD